MRKFRRFAVTAIATTILSGCFPLGPRDGSVWVTGSTPTNVAGCSLRLTSEASAKVVSQYPVAGTFRESFVVNPSRQGHTVALVCGHVVASRHFSYGKDVHIGGTVAL
jgi:hypothetical protein